MANAIRYSTTGDTQSLKKGNFFFGVGDVGKGPSSATTYYNGSTPSASGYTVYSFDASQPSRISYASPTSDSEFISITNVKSGQNFTGVTQCLNWYATQTDHVSVNKDYEPIVSNGLVLNLDASYTPSYTSSGTTWYDLAYSGNNGTLVNGPTFNSANGGSIVFDGVNDTVSIPYSTTLDPTTGITIESWIRPIDLTTIRYQEIYRKENVSARQLFSFQEYGTIISFGTQTGVSGSTYNELDLPITPSNYLNRWNHFVASYSSGFKAIYINGQLIGSNTITGSLSQGSATYYVGSSQGSSEFFTGSMSSVKVYSRGLSVQEVLQNYQAQFPRFLGKNIVMNGLVNYLDAGYNVSYPGTGTTWNNISGVSGGTGTLTNGPTYSTDGGGSIVFDGVDDIINITDNPSLDISNNISISLWFNPSTYTSSVYSVNFFKKFEGISNANFQFYFDGVYTPQKIRVLATRGGTWDSVSPDSAVIGINQWTNVVWTYSSTGGGLLYINGVSQGNSVGSGVLSTNNTNIQIGQSLNGKISSSSIYNKVLTPQEVLQNYQAQLPTIVGENFITNGLVLYLDASYRSSYPTTGTTWNNVSGVSGGTNTLVNGPVYSGTSGGTITFDGVDDYADFNAPNLGTTTTVEMWCKIGSGYSGKMFFGWNQYDVFCGSGNIGYNTAASDIYGISSSVVSSLGLVGNWKHYVFEMRSDVSYTNNKIYINGSSQILSQLAGSENVGGRNFNNGNGRIAIWRASNTSYNMPMECAVFKVYNRALTQNEITQNFNATKSRFGL